MPEKLTIAQRIMEAAARVVVRDGQRVFTRKDIYDGIGDTTLKRRSFDPNFQGMRADHPGGAPRVPEKFRNVFKHLEDTNYELTEYGKSILTNFPDDGGVLGVSKKAAPRPKPHSVSQPEPEVRLTVDDLSRMRRQLYLAMKQLGGPHYAREQVGALLQRLTAAGRIPREISRMMMVVTEARNELEYGDRSMIGPTESHAVLAS